MSTRHADKIVATRLPVALGFTVLTQSRVICSAPLSKCVTSLWEQLTVKTILLQSTKVIRVDQGFCFSEPRLPLPERQVGKDTFFFF